VRHKLLLLGTLAAFLAAAPVIAQDDDDYYDDYYYFDDDSTIDVTILEVYLEEGDNYDFTGGVRFRGMYEENYEDFSDDGVDPFFGNDDGFAYWPYRVRLGMLGRLPKNVYGYIEFQTASAAGLSDEQRHVLESNKDPFDLYMGLIKMDEIGGTNSELIFGRQELVFDNEFLFGNLDFYNGVSHDGIRYRWAGEENVFDGFWFQPLETFEFDEDIWFAGFHWSNLGWIESGDVSAYLYYVRSNRTEGVGEAGIYTIGARTGRADIEESGFVWNIEVAGQFGTLGKVFPVAAITSDDADVSAFGGEGLFGYEWVNGLDQVVFLRGYYASGDGDVTDDSAEAFQPFFQDFHNRLGIADIVPNSNIISASVGYGLQGERHGFGVELFTFMLAETMQASRFSAAFPFGVSDTQVGHGISEVAGDCAFWAPDCGGLAVTPQGASVDEDALGTEIDLRYDFIYSENLEFNVGLAWFQPGDAIELANTTFLNADDPALRLYGEADLRW
jgi:hypothetical protein